MGKKTAVGKPPKGERKPPAGGQALKSLRAERSKLGEGDASLSELLGKGGGLKTSPVDT